MKKKISPVLLATLSYGLYKAWSVTLRYEQFGRDKIDALEKSGTNMVFCLWHGEIFSVCPVKKQLKLSAIVSRSRDGEFLSNILKRLDITPMRGSSSRGGTAALRQAMGGLQNERRIPCVTMDGPRGPRHRVKDGVFFIARQCNALLVPVRVFCKTAKIINAWDRHSIPLPFSKVRVVFDEPYKLPDDIEMKDNHLIPQRHLLEAKMQNLENEYGFK